jgi:antiviral helicase SLH1
MSRAIEYDELPVRHNEDLINETLSANLPFQGHSFGLPMWDPHVKAFLLLQAHMSRIDLPITDYVGEQTSVLDQAIRIVQASIDVLTELGYLSSCLQMIALLQSIKCARWPTEPVCSILPGVEPGDVKDDTTLAAIANFSQVQVKNFAKKLKVHASQQARFSRAISALPHVAVSVEEAKALSVTVGLKRLNPIAERDARIYAPKFPKPQTEGWFVIVADVAKDEVIAVKRVGWSVAGGKKVTQGSKPTARATIKLPEPEGNQPRRLDVLVVSDAYIGLEHSVAGVEIPALPVVDDDIAKGKGKA